MQLIPARGRKLFPVRINPLYERCNLSPRGDGNITSATPVSLATIATYPREGTETLPAKPQRGLSCVATYPREGTETKAPARTLTLASVATYPREGTETRQRSGTSSMVIRCNLSPRGDKNLLSSKDKIGYNEATEFYQSAVTLIRISVRIFYIFPGKGACSPIRWEVIFCIRKPCG